MKKYSLEVITHSTDMDKVVHTIDEKWYPLSKKSLFFRLSEWLDLFLDETTHLPCEPKAKAIENSLEILSIDDESRSCITKQEYERMMKGWNIYKDLTKKLSSGHIAAIHEEEGMSIIIQQLEENK